MGPAATRALLFKNKIGRHETNPPPTALLHIEPMTDATAKPLVTALANGEPQAFADLYDRLGPALFRVARIILRTSTDAEDAVQDAFVELVRHRQRISHVRDLDAYLFTMLRHAVGRQMQRQQVEQRHLEQLPRADAPGPSVDSDDDLSNALQCLPGEQREVISLKIDGGLTFVQIAVVLGVSANTAASRYRYALEKLRRMLKEH